MSRAERRRQDIRCPQCNKLGYKTTLFYPYSYACKCGVWWTIPNQKYNTLKHHKS